MAPLASLRAAYSNSPLIVRFNDIPPARIAIPINQRMETIFGNAAETPILGPAKVVYEYVRMKSIFAWRDHELAGIMLYAFLAACALASAINLSVSAFLSSVFSRITPMLIFSILPSELRWMKMGSKSTTISCVPLMRARIVARSIIYLQNSLGRRDGDRDDDEPHLRLLSCLRIFYPQQPFIDRGADIFENG